LLAEWSRAADAEQRYRKLRHQGAPSAHRDAARRVFDELYGRCREPDVPPV